MIANNLKNKTKIFSNKKKHPPGCQTCARFYSFGYRELGKQKKIILHFF
jgi:hypothetical protein